MKKADGWNPFSFLYIPRLIRRRDILCLIKRGFCDILVSRLQIPAVLLKR